ncbi:MAG: tetratricopeptide repeat protein [Candidatus Hodarchaeales archaeon]|jgi:Flp pilus assembly protein TadD
MNENLKRGIELIKEVENKEAILHLERALKTNPEDAEIYRHLGLAYFNLGDYEHALSQWEHAITLDTAHFRTLWNLAYLHEMEQRFDKAHQLYLKAAKAAEKSGNSEKAKRYNEWAKRVNKKKQI